MYYEPCPVRTRYINSRYDSRSLDENVSSAFCLFVSFDMLVLMVLRNDSYIDVQRYLSSVTFFLLCPRYVLRVYNHDNRFLYYVYINYFITNILRTSAVNSTSFGSILIFASCVVGTCNILYGWVYYWEGSYFLSTIMVSIGIFTLGGEFWAGSNIIPILEIYCCSFHCTALSYVW